MGLGKKRRRKGKVFELQVANAFKPLYPKARRNLGEVRHEDTGNDILGCDPFKIQCKNKINYVSINTINEIKSSDGIHLLVTKGIHKPPMVVLSLDDFINIISDIGIIYPDGE